MRLVCPNCAAQYEVDPALIPEGGRDVQCSSCGETWFTTRDGAAAEPPAPTRPQPVPPAAPDHMPPTGQEDRSDDAPEPAAPPPRRRIDEAALAILREEAEREAAERRREAEGAFESQGDLGLEEDVQARRRTADAPPTDASLPASGPADMPADRAGPSAPEPAPETPPESQPDPASGVHADPPMPPAEDDRPDAPPPAAPDERPAHRDRAAAGSRRDLLPDIEEINSTLTATSARVPGPGDPVAQAESEDRQRHGFRLAFSLVMAVTAVLLLLYAFAPQVVRAVPASEDAMIGYVRWANGVWDGLDRLLAGAGAALTDLTK